MIKLDTIKSKRGNLSEIFISEFINWAKAYIIFGDQKVSQQHLRDPSNCHISLKSRILAFNIECSQSTIKGHDTTGFSQITYVSKNKKRIYEMPSYVLFWQIFVKNWSAVWNEDWVLALISSLMTLISGFNVS